MTPEEVFEAAVAKAVADADAWNALWPVGTPVYVQLDNGHLWYGKTKTKAAERYGVAVVWVTGQHGYYLLSRVRPAEVHALEVAHGKEVRP